MTEVDKNVNLNGYHGGFASNIACYFFSQHQNINNFFVKLFTWTYSHVE